MKNLFWLSALLCFPLFLWAQSPTMSSVAEEGGTGYNVIRVVDGPDSLLPLGNDTTQPYIRYLWIYGDGNYDFGILDSTLHGYNRDYVSFGNSGPFVVARAYMTDVYSGGDRPPSGAADTIIIDLDTFIIGDPMPVARDTLSPPGLTVSLTDFTTRTAAVPNNKYLRTQKSQDVRPRDTFINIASMKNQWGVPFQQGILFHFYNSPIKKTTYLMGEEGLITDTVVSQSDTFAQFNFNEALIFYNDHMGQAITDTTTIVSRYKNYIAVPFDSLGANEERHTYFEFEADSSMWQWVKGNQKAEARFLSVLVVNNPNNQLDLPGDILSQADSQLIQKLGLNEWLAALNNIDNDPNDDDNANDDGNFSLLKGGDFSTFQTVTGSFQIIDLDQITTEVAIAKDPNKLRAEACVCPNDDQAYTLLCRVDFQNEGLASTSQVHIQMDLPEALDEATLQDLIDYAPVPLSGSLGQVTTEHDLDNRKLYWKFKGFDFKSAIENGLDDPNTGGHIAFTIETRSGFSLDDVGLLEACIIFGDPAVGDTVCTTPVRVTTQSTAIVGADGQTMIPCKQCSGDPCEGSGNCDWCPFPVYYCLLIIFMLLLILILIMRWAAQPVFRNT